MKTLLLDIANSLNGIYEELRLMNDRNKPVETKHKKKEKKPIEPMNFI